MFAKTIVLSDAFLDMPLSARCLYFTLGMMADDDGFVNSPKAIMRQAGASEDDIKLLVAKKFVLPFDSGILIIKHWRINNYLRNDRYSETKYIEEKCKLLIEDNGAYSFTSGESLIESGIPSSGIPSKGKDSKDKDREDIGATPKRFTPPTLEEVTAYCKEKQNGVDPVVWWNFYDGKNWMVGKNKMVKWKSAIATWAQKTEKPIEQEKPKPKQYRPVTVNGETVMEVVNESSV